jgi:hypothetical protein
MTTAEITELFTRDPLSLTDQDIEKICEVFRARRQNFEADEKAGKKPTARKKAAPKVKEDTAGVMNSLDLGDLLK